jgi:DNA-directed RNA polymerase subunit RPC12/RpoP
MPIAVQCSGCSAKISAPDKMAGQQSNCPKCGHLLLIGLERIPVKAAPEPPQMRPVTRPAPAEKPAAPAKQPASSKPAAAPKKTTAASTSTKPAAAAPVAATSEKPPLIGHGMRRVLVILGVVAAILVLMSEVVAPLIFHARHGSKPPQTREPQINEEDLKVIQQYYEEQERKERSAKP